MIILYINKFIFHYQGGENRQESEICGELTGCLHCWIPGNKISQSLTAKYYYCNCDLLLIYLELSASFYIGRVEGLYMKCISEWFYQTTEYQSYLVCVSLSFFFRVHHSFYILESLQHGHFNSGSLKFCYSSPDYKSYMCVHQNWVLQAELVFFIQRWGCSLI